MVSQNFLDPFLICVVVLMAVLATISSHQSHYSYKFSFNKEYGHFFS